MAGFFYIDKTNNTGIIINQMEDISMNNIIFLLGTIMLAVCFASHIRLGRIPPAERWEDYDDCH